MANARNTELDREAALRRVAIVLSSLPAPVASQLLGSIDRDSKQLLRRTMTSLSDVDPLERKRALQAFKGSLEHQPNPSRQHDPIASSNHVQDHGAVGSGTRPGSRVVSSSVSSQSHQPQSTTAPLNFLDDVDDDTLVGLLRGEHPQAIALVLASIAPAQAARVLPCLDANLQSDALSRIGRLGAIPEDVVDEIANHLRTRIREHELADKNDNGKRALNAILAAMPQRPASQGAAVNPIATNPVPVNPVPANPAPVNPVPVTPVPVNSVPERASRMPSESEDSSVIQPMGFASADLSAVDQTHRLRLVTSLSPEEAEQDRQWAEEQTSQQVPQPSAQQSPQADDVRLPASANNSSAAAAAELSEPAVAPLARLGSTDAIHQHLIGLTSAELCAALGKVSTRQAMLTLCGLPNDTAEAVMAVLPRAHAKQVRQAMASLQSLELREIDEAKEAVAKLSIDGDRSTEATGSIQKSVRMAA